MILNTSELLEKLKKYDFSFFIISIGIFFIGILNLYSATHTSPTMNELYKVQLGWFVFSLFAGVMVSFVNTKNFYRYSYALFIFLLILLVIVLLFGHQGMGARRWIVLGSLRFQPSEIMKIGLVLALARWFTKRDPDRPLGFKQLIAPLLITAVPAGLVIVEPDLGTGFLMILVFFTICFYRKLKWRTLGVIALLGVISGTLMYQYGLKEYQRNRIIAFIDPTADARGSGYNAIQSNIAIGSGQFFGKGFKNSSQASLNYLPENHTDFIFSVYNEEHGFFGALFLISLYLLLFYRFIWLAASVSRFYDSIVVVGLMAIFFWHTAVNMGMVMGLIPVVGLPLPMMSYGGSSLMTFFLCNGIATSISNSRNLF